MFLLIKKFSALNLFMVTLTFVVINAQNNQIINSKNGKIEERNVRSNKLFSFELANF